MMDLEWNVLAKLNHTLAEDVRYRRNSEKHLLAMSFSHFDPTRTSRYGFRAAAVSSLDIASVSCGPFLILVNLV
jgi:hypothetical protein